VGSEMCIRDRNYGPGTPLKTIIEHVEKIVRERDAKKTKTQLDQS